MAFSEQAIRLMRERWRDPQPLAEELYAILRSWDQKGLDGPLKVNNDGSNEPAIQVTNFGGGDLGAISIVRDDGLTINLPGFDATFPMNEEDRTEEDRQQHQQQRGEEDEDEEDPATKGILEVLLMSVGADTLICTNPSIGNMVVKKPFKLRASTLVGPDGTTFVSTGAQSRTATRGSDSEDQIVIPQYIPGMDILYISRITGTTQFIDLNVDGRAWAVDQ